MSASLDLALHEHFAEITLNNPQRRNCINLALAEQLLEHVMEAQKTARVILLRAQGPIFCAGIDLKAPSDENRKASAILESLFEQTSIPIVARVTGGVIGLGVSLVSRCHVAIACESAWWWLPELPQMKRMPWGVMASIHKLASRPAIMGAMATTERFDARTAFAAGLVSFVTADSSLDRVVGQAVSNLSAIDQEATTEIVAWWRNAQSGTL